MKKPMELADQLVREHAERIAGTVTRVRGVRKCTQFALRHDLLTADVVRTHDGTYYVVAVVTDDGEAWSAPTTAQQRNAIWRIVTYCMDYDAEIRLAIDAALAPTCDGTNEDSLDADWRD